jgi:predicted dehydrogenase
VGIDLTDEESLLVQMPEGERFHWAAFCDEGLQAPRPDERPAAYHADYNVLLRDPAVELVLVGGPIELRRDLAVRALTAERHVVLPLPFCESALDAERVLKTAVRAGLIATANLEGRAAPDFRALRAALAAENAPSVQGLLCFRPAGDEGGQAPPGGLLGRVGLEMLDQVNLVLAQDVSSVSAHAGTGGPGRPASSLLTYLPLRAGGWAVCHVGGDAGAGLPRWLAHAGQATFWADGGQAVVRTGGTNRTYEAPVLDQDFWGNLHAAVREGAPVRCHPAEIVRAMKLHEAALASIEAGEPIVV